MIVHQAAASLALAVALPVEVAVAEVAELGVLVVQAVVTQLV